MDRWAGKVALVTGSSSGIGACIAVELANNGMIVVGFARRPEKTEELKDEITGSGELHAFAGDITKEEDINAVFEFIRSEFGAIHVLINNAGVYRDGKLGEQDLQLIREVIDTNVMGTIICTQQALKLMKENSIDGHIININSVAGHYVFNIPGESHASVYPATKHAITAMTEIIRHELRDVDSKIKISSVSPGFVQTGVIDAAQSAAEEEGFEGEVGTMQAAWPAMHSVDVANGVIYVLSTPPHVMVQELTIRPIGEMF